MDCLYELTLKHRELIEKSLAELRLEDISVRFGCSSIDEFQSIHRTLSNLFFDLLDNGDANIVNQKRLQEMQKLMAAGNDYNTFTSILNNIRNSIRDIIFAEAKDNVELYSCIVVNDKSFECLRKIIYDQWSGFENNQALFAKLEELKKQTFDNIKLLNETLEYDKVKTEFYSNLSHELRTPLNVILGTLQVMDMFNYQDPNFTAEKVKKYSKIMRQNCYRLLRLVNNLIDLNKLDAGFMNLNMDNYDIVSIVSQIVTSVTDYIENKGISLFFETETESKVVACDPDKMERIILNLMSNAIKYTEDGGSIKVKLWDKGESLFISIKDDGTGIPKEKQELVFRRFVQVEKSLTRNHQGSGIGLALVKSLVELHGGKISLISEAGQGCEFIIELPVKQAVVREKNDCNFQYMSNNKIERINIEFADIYSQ